MSSVHNGNGSSRGDRNKVIVLSNFWVVILWKINKAKWTEPISSALGHREAQNTVQYKPVGYR